MDDVRTVAVIDIGKTNAKVVLVDRDSGTELAARTEAVERRLDGPYPHADVARIAAFIFGSLADLNAIDAVTGIAVVAHGAAGAFLSGAGSADGLALPVLDYEFDGPDELRDEYEALRPDFDETFSPRLPGGLNLGAQIFWQEKRFAGAVAGAACYVTYPQYWVWLLTGVVAADICSLGCHTDLWNPRKRSWSGLIARARWEARFAPVRPPFDRLGPVRPEIAAGLGLAPDATVVCGIHDSSASLLPHLIARKPPFTVASTGTWTVIIAVGGSLERLDPDRDTLANVTAFGDPVPCARFMGGREFERLAGPDPGEPDEGEVDRVIAGGIMALPTFAPGVGPFADRRGQWSHPPEGLRSGERTAAASLYLALVTAQSMACADAAGPTIVEGPFAKNRLYCAALAAISGRPVLPSAGLSGTGRGAACLFHPERGVPTATERPAAPLAHQSFASYVARWRERARA